MFENKKKKEEFTTGGEDEIIDRERESQREPLFSEMENRGNSKEKSKKPTAGKGAVIASFSLCLSLSYLLHPQAQVRA